MYFAFRRPQACEGQPEGLRYLSVPSALLCSRLLGRAAQMGAWRAPMHTHPGAGAPPLACAALLMCPAQQIKQRARVLMAVVEQLTGAQVDVLELCLIRQASGGAQVPPLSLCQGPKVFCDLPLGAHRPAKASLRAWGTSVRCAPRAPLQQAAGAGCPYGGLARANAHSSRRWSATIGLCGIVDVPSAADQTTRARADRCCGTAGRSSGGRAGAVPD